MYCNSVRRTIEPRWHRQSGMTLIEVLVATAITGILLATCYGLYSRTSETQARLDKRASLVHQVRVLTQRLGVELRSLTTTTRGDDIQIGQDQYGQSYLEMTTRAAAESAGTSVRVRYQLTPPDPEKTVQTLQRGERQAILTEDTLQLRPLFRGVESLNWQVFDGSQWRDEWSSGRPKTLRLTLTLTLDDESFAVKTAFDLPQGGS